MNLLLTGLWPALAAALVLGCLVGAITGLPQERFGLAAAACLAVLLALLAGLAFGGVMVGEVGLWVETGALLLASYLAGCVIGGTGRRIAGRS